MIKTVNRRSFVQEIIYVMLTLFVFSLVIYLAYNMYSSFNTAVSPNPYFQNPTTQNVLDKGNVALINFDKFFVMALVLLSIGVWIAGYFVDTSPLFLPIAIVVDGILIIFSAQFANVYEQVYNAQGLAETVLKYPNIHYIMIHLPSYIAIITAVLIIIIYSKLRTYNGG